MMRSGRDALRLALAFGSAATCTVSSGADADAPESPLAIDPATFTTLPAERSSPRMSRTGGGHQGPRIALLSSGREAVYRAGEPMVLHAELLPAADGAAPDMETLQIKVRKGWFGKDITDKVEPYVEGAAVRVPEVDFSGYTGDFRFEIHIRDERGRPGEAQFQVTIRS